MFLNTCAYTGEIPRIKPPSREVFVRDYATPHRPVILEGLAETWPALSRWNREYLLDILGENEVVCAKQSQSHVHPHLSQDIENRSVEHTMELPLKRYFDFLWSDEQSTSYCLSGDELSLSHAENKWNDKLRRLLADCEVPEYVDRSTLDSAGFWFSRGGITAWPHFDGNGMHNINVQLEGRKSFALFHPDVRMNPFRLEQIDRCNFSKNFQPGKRPDQPGWTGTLKKGDALLIPAYWWHQVDHEDHININLNFWFRGSVVPMTRTSLRWTCAFLVRVLEENGIKEITPAQLLRVLEDWTEEMNRPTRPALAI